MASNQAVFGIFKTRAQVEDTIAQLRAEGFRAADVSVLYPQNPGLKELAHEKNTKAPEGAAGGAGAGAVLGGTLGWLVGIGALVIPGLGPFVAAGPIVALLAGAGVGGAVGGVVGTLVGMGVPEYEAKRYEGLMKEGGILFSVHSDNGDWTKKAKRILEACGASQIASSSESRADVPTSHPAHF